MVNPEKSPGHLVGYSTLGSPAGPNLFLMNGVEIFGLTEAKMRVNRVKRNCLHEADLRSASVGPICYNFELIEFLVWPQIGLSWADPDRLTLMNDPLVRRW